MKNDYQTSTVDGAMGFQRAYNDDYETEETHGDDFYPEEEETDDDYCGCSDPGCPCGGRKVGGL